MADANRAPRTSGWAVAILGAIIAVAGLVLLAGGLYLISLSGSWYFAFVGAALTASGILIARGRAAGALLYAIAFAATLIWAWWEVGFHFWPLVSRLYAPALVAVLVALAYPRLSGGRAARAPALVLAALLFVGLVAATAYSFFPHPIVSALAPPAERTAIVADQTTDWRAYGRTPRGTRFAPLDQITPENVGELEVAWTFRTGDVGGDDGENQNTPIQIGDTLFVCTPHNLVFALDADTGKEKWKFDPKASSPFWQRCRGVGYHDAAAEAPASAQEAEPSPNSCARRVILSTIDARLIALDAETGAPCAGFGDGGTVDLKQGMGEFKPGYYFQTSAPTVIRDLILIGGWVADNWEIDEPSGVVRAFDVRTGALVWAWDLGNPAITGPAPPEGYTRGTPNVWSTPSYDDELGLVYLPTGNATPDYWGGMRTKQADDYNSSIVALDIATGRERWRFQTVHHDLWDYDVPAQPALFDIPDGTGGTIPALIQTTKRGQIFLLDRRDGTPIAEVEERPVPQGPAEGDRLSPTQPYSVGMPAIGAAPLTEADMWGLTPFDQLYCRIRFRQLRYDGEFTPPRPDSTSLQFPGFYGGMNWGSVAIDEGSGYLIVNDMRVGHRVRLVARPQADQALAKDSTALSPQRGAPFAVELGRFLSPLGIPCHKPPYGTMTAIDLKSRDIVWQIPMGTVRDMGPLGMKTHLSIPIGMPTLGGPISTESGLIFFTGTQDYYLRAIDAETGKELWKARLPVAAPATPMTYVSPKSGRQFVVVTAGGIRHTADRGDYVIAYALPQPPD